MSRLAVAFACLVFFNVFVVVVLAAGIAWQEWLMPARERRRVRQVIERLIAASTTHTANGRSAREAPPRPRARAESM